MDIWRFWAVMILILGAFSAYMIHRDLDERSGGGFLVFYTDEN
jgi:hypothetical protein